MEHLFQRGTKLAGTIRITKLLSEGDEWAIYSTDSDSNVLAINQALYNYWCEKFRLQDSPIFIETDIDLFCFFGKRGYLVSSLEWGPYPCDSSQIDAFADAFGSFQRSYPNEDLTKALYIEEYSMILPIHNSQKNLNQLLCLEDGFPVVSEFLSSRSIESQIWHHGCRKEQLKRLLVLPVLTYKNRIEKLIVLDYQGDRH